MKIPKSPPLQSKMFIIFLSNLKALESSQVRILSHAKPCFIHPPLPSDVFPTPQVVVPSPPGLTGDGLLLCLQIKIRQSPAQVSGFIFCKIPVPLYHLPEGTHDSHRSIWIPPEHSDGTPHYGTNAKN